jgi:HSP90 family molecular chaperone
MLTHAEDKDIQTMMNPTHYKIEEWFKNIYNKLREKYKKRLEAKDAFLKENPHLKPEEYIEEELQDIVYFIAFSGHGTASSEKVPNGTMET